MIRSPHEAKLSSILVLPPREQFLFFEVFTLPARSSIALEPMTCNVDAFHNREGLVELAAGESWEVQFRLVHSLEPA
jgi:galactose mutarotase-like enzyme